MRSILLLLFFCGASAYASDYLLILKSGQTFKCTEKYKRQGDMVSFTLSDGGEMSMPAWEVDFDRTHEYNRSNRGYIGPSRSFSGDLWARLSEMDINQYLPVDGQKYVDRYFSRMGILQWISALLVWFLGHVTLFWVTLGGLGESVSFRRCLVWNLLGVAIVGTLLAISLGVIIGFATWMAAVELAANGLPILAKTLTVVAILVHLYLFFWTMARFLRVGKGAALTATVVATIGSDLIFVGFLMMMEMFRFLNPIHLGA